MTYLSGQIIRGYEFLRPIGSGGYGMVYEAIEQAVDRRVAIKIILPEHANQPEFIANFEHEAKLVAQLEHLNIVPLYTYWRDEQGAFLVMRYIKGGSLRETLVKRGALSLAQTLRLITQIAEALHVAHESGVVHRDLKPDNILIDERGNAYLTDFGIAKRAEGNNTPNDTIKGSLAYLSPEQIQSQPVSPQTDIYAFGIMLYEMLAGKHPFQDTPVAMMVMKHLHEALPPLLAARPDLPSNLDDIISKATAKDPADRYKNVLDVVKDLQAVIGDGVLPSAIKPAELPKPVPHQPANPDQRNRYAMLQNVRKFWIEGVLDNSLHNAVKIDLGLQTASGVVNNPWDTLLRTPNGDKSLLTNTHIINVFEQMNGKLLILGDPGGGKTTTLLELAHELLARAASDEAHPLPVVFNLSSWGEKQMPLAEWLIDELNSKYQVPHKVATQWIQDEAILPLLDGLDEVTATARDACVQAINTYRGEHGFVDIVVCSRIKDYEALTTQLKLNGAIVIQPLDDEQIRQYLTALGSDVAVIQDSVLRDEHLRELARSPLMLSIMILAYRGTSVSDIPDFDNLEAQRKHLFDIYVQRMFERRTSKLPYTQKQTLHYLHELAHMMHREARSEFYIEDLQPHFLEKTLQRRYIISVSIAFFLLATFLMVVTFVINLPLIITNMARFGQTVNFSVTGFVLLIICVLGLYGLIHGVSNYLGVRSLEIKPIERVDWSFVEMLHNAPRFMILGLGIGALYGVLFGGFFTILFGSQIGIAMLTSVTIASVAFYLITGGFMTSAVETKVKPNQGIRSSVTHAVIFGVIAPITYSSVIGIAHAFAFDLVFGLSLGVSLLIPLLLAASLSGEPQNPASAVVGKHIILRYILERQELIPRNFAAFLDYASSLIFLRKVGGGYIFIHRYLLEYFADLAANEK